ncbi:MAG: hypothetical protein IKW39_00370 [Alphaproteobacteria bacterium]|nr:hypothetical protein [Alphaproteobacteria bacterium]
MSENIKWNAEIMELPDDISFAGCMDRLNSSKNYKSDKLFAYDCRKVAQYAVNDSRFNDDVFDMYDRLLNDGVSQVVEDDICYSLGEMLHFNSSLKNDVAEIGVKYHPLFEKNLNRQSHLYSDELLDVNSLVVEEMRKRNDDLMGKIKIKIGKDKDVVKQNTEVNNQQDTVNDRKFGVKVDMSLFGGKEL